MTGRPRGAGPGHLRLGRALFDALEAGLARAPIGARPALRLAARIGAARGLASGRWPAPREVAALFGTDERASRRIALEIARNEARTRLVLRRTAGRPLAPFAPLVRWRDPAAAAALAPPRILVTAHVGAVHLLAAALARLPASRTVVRWSALHEPGPGESNAIVEGGLGPRSQALLDAVARLRAGGLVSTTIDGGYGAARRVAVLGHALDLGMGAFALAGWTGAAIVPVAVLWEGEGVVCEVGAPLAGPDDAARWLEELLRRDPGQINLGLLRHLLYGLLGPVAEAPAEHPDRI